MKSHKVFQAFTCVLQFGINMLVPLLGMSWLGLILGRKVGLSWLMIPFFFIGGLAGFRNCWIMAKRLYEDDKKDEGAE